MYADGGTQRHDPSHLLTHRLAMPLPALAAALEAPASATGSGSMMSAMEPGNGRQSDLDGGQQQPAAEQRQVSWWCAVIRTRQVSSLAMLTPRSSMAANTMPTIQRAKAGTDREANNQA